MYSTHKSFFTYLIQRYFLPIAHLLFHLKCFLMTISFKILIKSTLQIFFLSQVFIFMCCVIFLYPKVVNIISCCFFQKSQSQPFFMTHFKLILVCDVRQRPLTLSLFPHHLFRTLEKTIDHIWKPHVCCPFLQFCFAECHINGNMQPLGPDFFHLAKYTWDSLMLLCLSGVCSFLPLSDMPSYGCTTVCLSRYLLMGL